jgi:hypothetical protein
VAGKQTSVAGNDVAPAENPSRRADGDSAISDAVSGATVCCCQNQPNISTAEKFDLGLLGHLRHPLDRDCSGNLPFSLLAIAVEKPRWLKIFFSAGSARLRRRPFAGLFGQRTDRG